MNTTIHRSKKNGDGSISFPNLQCWNPATETATIAAQNNGERVSCRIEFSVLKKRYKSRAEEPMQLLSRHRVQVENAARKLIENRKFEKDGSVMIGFDDLD